MKKLLYTLLLFLSIFCYGQENEYKKAVVLYNAKNYTETIAVSEKILIGNPNPIIKVYASYMIADSYKSLENYSQAYIKFKDYLDILNNSNSFSKKDLEKAKANIETIIADLQTKISNDENKEIKNNNQITSNSESSDSKIKAVETTIITDAKVESKNTNTELKSTEDKSVEITKPIPNEKTVTLTVSGTGKTIEEAKTNALRSAIEQAFGAFISSKTEILNDNIVKDEIVSVANGNVQKYDVVSQVEIPNNGYAITLSATVSITKLTSFAESKGVVVEFKGGMFAANMKLQKINEDAELIAIKNLTTVSFELLKKSFDYKLLVSEPKIVNNSNENYEIYFNVGTEENQNYNSFKNYFISTIQNIAISNEEYENLINAGKKVKYLIIDGKLIYKFRNKISADILTAFFISTQHILTDFRITSNLGELNYKKGDLFLSYYTLDSNGEPKYIYISKANTLLESYVLNYEPDEIIKLERPRENKLLELYSDTGTEYSKLLSKYSKEKLNDNTFDFKTFETTYNAKYLQEKFGLFDDIIFFDTKFNSPKLKLKKIFNLSELQKIDAFKIEKNTFN
jgi:hypothetical protein